MVETVPLHAKTKGPLGENEDWWRLLLLDDGTMQVEHEWSHHDAYGRGDPDVGTRIFSIDEFLSGDHDEAAKAALKKALAERKHI